MKVLLVGNGGREHTLAWKINQSKRVSKLYCTRPNAGIAQIAQSVDIDPSDIEGLAEFAIEEGMDLTVVGPELMLAQGIVDLFCEKGLRIFGPSKAAAMVESSKIFSKRLMRKQNVPTADFDMFTDSKKAEEYIREKGAPIVLKADGLAAGKGVIVAQSVDEALEAVRSILDEKIFGEAGASVLIEDCLFGTEATFLVFTDGKTVVPMASSQDHKRAFDGDKGKNTGGMGAFSPSPLFNEKVEEKVLNTVITPFLSGLKDDGIVYKGVLYAGLMISPQGDMNVIEFNCRFGDPEAQVIIPRLDSDIMDIFEAIIDEKLDSVKVNWKSMESACVVLASGGYPDSYKKGIQISGLSDSNEKKSDNIAVFHAGTALCEGELVTSGGRVMAVSALADTVSQAIGKCYDKIDSIHFEGMHFRTDIGKC